MFLSVEKKLKEKTAAVEITGKEISYGELVDFSYDFGNAVEGRSLVFILCDNSIGALAGFVGSLQNRIVPLLLGKSLDDELLHDLIENYSPSYIWCPTESANKLGYPDVFSGHEYSLLNTGLRSPELHEDLSLLLSTSGSTGSPKLVRHSYRNIEKSAENVARFFELDGSERPIAILPIQYTMGLSVITSHLFAGSTILLCNTTLTDPAFWKYIKELKATSFTGVPYSFEILQKLRFTRMDLPDLKVISQGGGKLSEKLFQTFAEYANTSGKKFIATYGQTEGTARMAYLPPEMALQKICSIGKAIPEGEFQLVNEAGEVIREIEAKGELVYHGPNVTMGYAYSSEDLRKDDIRKGELRTGDIAYRDEDGYYYIIGRLNRFLKLYGLRIGLDEVEYLVKKNFNIDCFCSGTDEVLEINVTTDHLSDQIINFICDQTGLFHRAVKVNLVDEIRRNEAGKVINSSSQINSKQ